jgi:acetyl esterase/lipase
MSSRQNTRKRLLWGLAAVVVVIQLIPIDRSHPPARAEIEAPPEVMEILRTACYDCHSYETEWPWYGYVAPVSWWLAFHQEEAQEEMNFSDWGLLEPAKRAELQEEIWEEVEEGDMPLPAYRWLHPEARLDDRQLRVLETWSHGEAARVDSDLVYGTASGEKLMMDIHHPAHPNGIGVVSVAGSAWRAGEAGDGVPLKEQPGYVEAYVEPLVAAGYTVFSLDHRGAPRFPYPAAVEDTQRAVRFVRHHAQEFGVAADRLGAVGFSSGANLVSLLGVSDGRGRAEAPDPVDRESSKVQCVVGLATPTDLSRLSRDLVAPYLGDESESAAKGGASPVDAISLEASPVTHVTADDAPTLLVHGERDRTVPSSQSVLFEQRLRESGVEVKLVLLEDQAHPIAPTAGEPSVVEELLEWLDRHLLESPSSA